MPAEERDQGRRHWFLHVGLAAGILLATLAAPMVPAQGPPPPTVSVVASDPSASEAGQDNGVFTIKRTGAGLASLEVVISLSGTATLNTDYSTQPVCTTSSCTLTIPASSPTTTLEVRPLDDTADEPTELAQLTVQPGAGYTVSPANAATVRIADNDLPSVTVLATDDQASETADNPGQFRFTRTAGDTQRSLVVHYEVQGNATNGADYSPLSGKIIIAAGATSQTVAVTPVDDAQPEPPENVSVTVTPDTAYVVGNPSVADVAILDNDLPVVAIVSPDPAADEAGLESATFTVSRPSGDTSTGLRVSYAASGTAIPGTDYELSPVCCDVIIPVNERTADIVLTPKADAFDEAEETVVLRLIANANYSVGAPSEATAVIVDDELPTVDVTAPDRNAHEDGTQSGRFRFNRTTNNTASDLVVRYSLSGNATNGADYGPLAGVVTIRAGFSSENVTVSATNDALDEPSENVTVTLLDDPAYAIGEPNAANVTLLDDDLPTVNIATLDPDAREAGADPARFLVARVTNDTTTDLRVAYEFLGTAHFDTDENKTDFAVIPECCNVTIEAGNQSAEIVLIPVDDDDDEPRESIEVRIIADANYTVGTPSTAQATLEDADVPEVTIQAVDDSAREGTTETGTFRVTRPTNDTSVPLVVSYTLGGEATNGVDYALLSGTVTIAAGSTMENITVTPLDDPETEGAERVIATLSPSADYAVGTPSTATVLISDNEIGPLPPPPPPTLAVAVPAPNASEWGPTEGRFEIRRASNETNETVTASYSLSGSATNATDYTVEPPCCNVTIPSGAESATITVTPLQDAETEPTETVRLTLQPGSTYLLGSPHEGNMTLSDYTTPLVTLNATDATASEAGDPGNFRIQRTGNSSQPVTVHLLIRGTASNGDDYARIPSSVVMEAEQTFVDVPLTPTDDGVDEPDEDVIVEIESSGDYRLGSVAETRATATILDDDQAPSVYLSAPDTDASEATLDPAVIRLIRVGGVASQSLTVRLAVAGTAKAADDFQPFDLSVTFQPGQSTHDLVVAPADDGLNEPTETVTLTVEPSPSYIVATPTGASVRIFDNDPSGITNFFVEDVTATRLESGSIDVAWNYELPPLASQPKIAGWLVWRATSPFVLLESIEDPAARRLIDTTAPEDVTPAYAISFFLESGEGRFARIGDMPGFVGETELPQTEEVPSLEREPEKTEDGVPVWVLLLTGVIFIAAMAGIGWFMIERRTRRPTAPSGTPPAPPVEAGAPTPASEPTRPTPTVGPKSEPGPR